MQILETDDFDAYRQQITDGQFDLYIGEIKLYNNMDLSPSFPAGLPAPIWPRAKRSRRPTGRSGPTKAPPVISRPSLPPKCRTPLLWRSNTVVAARGISGLTSSLSDVFYSLDGLRFGNS